MGQLRDRMEQDLILRKLSPATRRNYLLYCRKFAGHYSRSPEELGEAEIRAYLLYLIQVEQVSYPTYRQNLAALKFLYSVTLGRVWEVERIPFPRRQRHEFPEVMGRDQLTRFFGALKCPKCRALFLTCYAAGLRISEACALRVEDVDSRRMVIRVRYAKGSKQRYTMLSPQLLIALREYWKKARPPEWLFPGQGNSPFISADTARQVFRAAREIPMSQALRPIIPATLAAILKPAVGIKRTDMNPEMGRRTAVRQFRMIARITPETKRSFSGAERPSASAGPSESEQSSNGNNSTRPESMLCLVTCRCGLRRQRHFGRTPVFDLRALE